MISIDVPDVELYDNHTCEFITIPGGTFDFEHSLRSIAEWESHYQVPFLSDTLTEAEIISYFPYMCLDEGLTAAHITPEVMVELSEYINDPYTATTIRERNSSGRGKVMTSESIYAVMVAGRVPFECQDWNLNRLLILLRVVALNQEEPKKMSRQEIMEQNTRLNEERKQKYNTKG